MDPIFERDKEKGNGILQAFNDIYVFIENGLLVRKMASINFSDNGRDISTQYDYKLDISSFLLYNVLLIDGEFHISRVRLVSN